MKTRFENRNRMDPWKGERAIPGSTMAAMAVEVEAAAAAADLGDETCFRVFEHLIIY